MRQSQAMSPRGPFPRGEDAGGDVLSVLTLAFVVIAALFGGASRENPLRLAAVELAAILLGVLALRRLALGAAATGARRVAWPLAILGLMVALLGLQSLPLPPALWTALPGEAPRLEGVRLLGEAPPWLPMSLAPAETLRALLALIPPASMILAMGALGARAARPLVGAWLGLATAGLILGVAQVAAPAGGLAYLYRTTNLGSLVGLFANRNHEAAFLLALLPFAAALIVHRPSRRRGEPPTANGITPAVPLLAGLFMVIATVALGVIRSRTGVLLAAPAILAAGLILAARPGGGPRSWGPLIALAVAMGLAALAVAVFGLDSILDRFAPKDPREPRFEAWPLVARAVWDHLPLGAGVGAFQRMFEAAEPLTLVAPSFFNHAHNDYLEIALEAGLPGLTLVVLGIGWWLLASVRAWRSGDAFARAAAAATGLLLAASLTDYPLRTETLAVFMAFCAGVLATRGGERRR